MKVNKIKSYLKHKNINNIKMKTSKLKNKMKN